MQKENTSTTTWHKFSTIVSCHTWSLKMTLIHDEWNEVWVWVETNDHDTELSPGFDSESDARLWRTRMINILIKGKNE
jgi:hypothetical protein